RLTGTFTLPTVPVAVLYFVILIAAYGVLSAPLSYYRGFVLPRRYGLSTQSVSGWLGDLVKAGVLAVALVTGIIAAGYWFITTVPQLWWLLSWGFVVLVSLILSVLAPVVIVPIFFRMKPLADAELRKRLEQLAERAGIGVGGIYTLDFSSKGTTANAALMGVGKTRRIVLSDTLLKQYSTPEIEVIMAHELGHRRHNDIVRLFTLQSAILLVGFYVTGLILKASIVPLGFSGIDDIAALPLLVLVFAVLSLLLMPLANTYIRGRERAADEFALRLTGNPQAFITMMTRLTDQNLAEAQPGRWVERLLYDHPSYNSRVEHASYYAAHRRDKRVEL
ncbi:MAG: M48 family metallopeptidase, partial [Dehalococcoidales bacterium]